MPPAPSRRRHARLGPLRNHVEFEFGDCTNHRKYHASHRRFGVDSVHDRLQPASTASIRICAPPEFELSLCPLDRAAVHAAHLFGAGFFVVLSFDSRLESIIEKRGWGSPESPKRLMTPAVQQQPAGVSSFICQAVRFSGFFRTDSQPASMVLIRRMVRDARRAQPCTIDERPL
jgi:hypothetical protein